MKKIWIVLTFALAATGASAAGIPDRVPAGAIDSGLKSLSAALPTLSGKILEQRFEAIVVPATVLGTAAECGVFPTEDCAKVAALLKDVPRQYLPYSFVVMLKVKVRAEPGPGGRYTHKRIYSVATTLHPHVALMGGYTDDVITESGSELRFDRVYMSLGLISLVSRKPLPKKTAPLSLLDDGQKDIFKGTLEDIVVKCGVTEAEAQRMNLKDLSKLADAECAAKF